MSLGNKVGESRCARLCEDEIGMGRVLVISKGRLKFFHSLLRICVAQRGNNRVRGLRGSMQLVCELTMVKMIVFSYKRQG